MNHWVIWAIKLVLGLVATIGTVYVVSFSVADYVVKANTAGLQNSIDNLNSNLTNFNNNLTAANSLLSEQLLDLRKEKEGLAVSIAQEVAKLQLDQGLQGKDIELIKAQFEESLTSVTTKSNMIRVTFDGGKTFDELSAEAFIEKYGQALKLGRAFAVVSGGFVDLSAVPQ